MDTAVDTKITVDDHTLYEASIKPWELLASPLEANPFRYTRHQVVTASIVFYREWWRVDTRVTGALPAGLVAFAAPVRIDHGTRFWEAEHPLDGFPAVRGGTVDMRFGARHDHVLTIISEDTLNRWLCAEHADVFLRGGQGRIIQAPAPLVRAYSTWVSSLLQASTVLGARGVPATSIESAARGWLERIAAGSTVENRGPRQSSRPRAVALALEKLHADGLCLSVSELAAAGGVSVRTLQYAFAEMFQMDIRTYLRRSRLRDARLALLLASPGESRVADVAVRCGFFELGRFAGAYRRLFGELPSETLRAPPPTKPPVVSEFDGTLLAPGAG